MSGGVIMRLLSTIKFNSCDVFNLAYTDAAFIQRRMNISVEEFDNMANKVFFAVSFWVDNKVHDNVSVQNEIELNQLFDKLRRQP
jgi:hypothetical protein